MAALDADRKRVEEELAQKKDEAERSIALQKERNKAELEALQAAFKVEQEQAAWFQIEQLKAEIDRDRKIKLAEIEEDRKRGEQELAGIRANMAREREELEKSVQEQRGQAEMEIRRFRESVAMEQKKQTEELEAKLIVMKRTAEAEVQELRTSATKELDKLKSAAQKKEHDLREALIQAKRMIGEAEEQVKLQGGLIKTLESEAEKSTTEKDQVLQELESLKADYKMAIESRATLVSEVDELRAMLK